MLKQKHTAIYISNFINKNLIIEQIVNDNFQNLKSEIYSAVTLDDFMKHELLHDDFQIYTNGNKGLSTMSSGQQKQALIQYLLHKKPDVLILDDLFSNIDIAFQKSILQTLIDVKNEIIFVQIFQRKQDLLPFIDTIFVLDVDNILQEQKRSSFISDKKREINHLEISVPNSFVEYDKTINPLVQFIDVCVNYEGKKVLNNINWKINSGEFWQLIGPNGSGKSTILSMIIGDNPKAYGENITLFGRKKGTGESVREIKSKIGYCNATMTHQFDRLDSTEKMIVAGFQDTIGLYFSPSDIQLKIAQDWLNLLGIYNLKDKPFNNLSLGQQRIVMVARAMIKNPLLLILDEPTAGLDDDNTLIFINLINKIASQSSTAIIYVSHRAEKGLKPKFIYELLPSQNNSGYKGHEINT